MSAAYVAGGVVLLGLVGFTMAFILSGMLLWWENPARAARREHRAQVRALRAANDPLDRNENGWW